jgi:hypothetical protein
VHLAHCHSAHCFLLLSLLLAAAGFVWQTAENEWGHAVVATALSVVDDTALTSKTLLPELKVTGEIKMQLHHTLSYMSVSCA